MFTSFIINYICGLIGFYVFKVAMDKTFPHDPPSFYVYCFMALIFGFSGTIGLIFGLILSVLLMTLKLFKITKTTNFYVDGGIYKDFTFSVKVEPEFYGPFETYEDAYDVWKASVWSNVDNALHRLTIKEK